MIANIRWGFLLCIAMMTLVGGCGWSDSESPVGSVKVRPGAERAVALSAGLPPAGGNRQYDAGDVPVDEARSAQIGLIVAAKGGQKAQLEALAKESAEGDRKARLEADRAAEARRETVATAVAARPPKTSASSPQTALAAPPSGEPTTTTVPTETAATQPLPIQPPAAAIAAPVVEAASAPLPAVATAAAAADPDKAFQPPPGWMPPTTNVAPAAKVVAPALAAPPLAVQPPTVPNESPATIRPPPPASAGTIEPKEPIATAPPPETPRPAPKLATLSFRPQSAEISGEARAELDRILESASAMRMVELRAFSSGRDINEARKIALARGLSVRAYLIDGGLQARIEVGKFVSEGSGPGSDRVDVLAAPPPAAPTTVPTETAATQPLPAQPPAAAIAAPVVKAAPAPPPAVATAAAAADPDKAFQPPPGWMPPTTNVAPAAKVVAPPLLAVQPPTVPNVPPVTLPPRPPASAGTIGPEPIATAPPPPPPETPRPAPKLATLSFRPQSAEISGAARAELDRIVQSASAMRMVELRAFSSGRDISEARKIALARGLSVRSYLIDRGLRVRIEVGAFASEGSGPGSDRVDVFGP